MAGGRGKRLRGAVGGAPGGGYGREEEDEGDDDGATVPHQIVV